ncbi:MAG: TetR/AcrR family transcriptional regulator [Deltaproteobacteria bacterium]|nr:TetR/AcrR family transcriptional regulator [Deltaproteobacteria bacterium]
MPANRLLKERKALNRRTIQEVAREIFFEKGYTNSTIEEIAKRAGMGKGSVYYYFSTKDEIFLSLTFPLLDKINESLKGIKKKLENRRYKNCKDIIMAFYNHFMSVYDFDSKGLRILQAIQQEDLFFSMSEETRDKFSVQARIGFQLSREILSKAMEMDLFPSLNPFEVIDSLWGAFMGIVQLEENKSRISGKSHLKNTIKMSFSFLAEGICSIKNPH